jgi:hypothetical protein
VVLLDLVQQGSIADFQQPRCCFSVPAGFLESRRDFVPLRFTLHTLYEGLEAGAASLSCGAWRGPVFGRVPTSPRDVRCWLRLPLSCPVRQAPALHLRSRDNVTRNSRVLSGCPATDKSGRRPPWQVGTFEGQTEMLRQLVHEVAEQEWDLILALPQEGTYTVKALSRY